MSQISADEKLQALLEVYNQDREEERVQWSRLHNLFTTFVLLFLGAANAFMQVTQPTMAAWWVFAGSVAVASGLYWYLHDGMQTRLGDAAKIKEGREILLKVLLNGTRVADYQENLVEKDKSVDESLATFETRMNSAEYPFLIFDDVIKTKMTYNESAKKYMVVAAGLVAMALTFVYCLRC